MRGTVYYPSRSFGSGCVLSVIVCINYVGPKSIVTHKYLPFMYSMSTPTTCFPSRHRSRTEQIPKIARVRYIPRVEQTRDLPYYLLTSIDLPGYQLNSTPREHTNARNAHLSSTAHASKRILTPQHLGLSLPNEQHSQILRCRPRLLLPISAFLTLIKKTTWVITVSRFALVEDEV